MNVNETVQHFKSLKRELQEKMAEAFQSSLWEFFVRVPEVNTIYWHQCTPYFNDGDPCVFVVAKPSFSPMSHDEITSPYHFYEYDDMDHVENSTQDFLRFAKDTRLSSESQNMLEDILNLFAISKEYLLSAYGDHAFIRLYMKDGSIQSKVEIFEHD
jgi:hypothetical protein